MSRFTRSANNNENYVYYAKNNMISKGKQIENIKKPHLLWEMKPTTSP